MPGLANVVVKDSYKSLLRVDNNTSGITGTAQQVYDGEGTSCPLYLGSSSVDIIGSFTVGVDDLGYDVKFFGDTADRYWLWDTSADGVLQRGTLTVGINGTGHDVKFFGDTADRYMLWDQSADKLIVQGAFEVTTGVTFEGTLNVEGDATFSGDSVYLQDDSYDSGTPVKALSLNTSDGAIKVAGVEMKTTGVLKLKTLTQVQQEALTPAIGDMVMRTDGISVKTEPYLYSD